MFIKRPKDFELNRLLDTILMTIKAGDETMRNYEFDYDKKLKDIKDTSSQATEAKNSIDNEKFKKIRERRISTVKFIIDTASERLKELESKH